MRFKRENSVLTHGEVESLSTIKNFPVFVGATTDSPIDDIFEDLTVDICKQTGILQLRNLIDPSVLYSQFHSEACGGVWENHHELFANLILKYQHNNSILEIGGSDSRLALDLLNRCDNIKRWTIVEPNTTHRYDDPRLVYVREFFDETTDINDDFDMIVHSHVLEHIYNPYSFLDAVASNLNYGDYHIFSVPNLYAYLKNKYINALTFEHTLFLTEEIIDHLLPRHGLETIEKVYYQEHSILYVTRRGRIRAFNLPNKYAEYKKMYIDFFGYYQDFVTRLNEELKITDRDVYLFGGHIFSQYLITLGLRVSHIKCILDNSQLKSGKRLYGTNLMIKLPQEVNLNENSLIILKAGSYSDEIKQRLLSINKNIQFYE